MRRLGGSCRRVVGRLGRRRAAASGAQWRRANSTTYKRSVDEVRQLMPTDLDVFTTLSVQWGDQDCFQHVNNARYVTYFESSRISLLTRIGFIHPVGVGPILKKIHVTYRHPVTFPDELVIGCRVAQVLPDRIFLHHQAFSRRHGILAAQMDDEIVAVSYETGKKDSIPQSVLTALQRQSLWPRKE